MTYYSHRGQRCSISLRRVRHVSFLRLLARLCGSSTAGARREEREFPAAFCRVFHVLPQKSSGQKWNTALLSVSPTPKSLGVAQHQRSWPSSSLIVSLNTGQVSTGKGRPQLRRFIFKRSLRSTTFFFGKKEEKASSAANIVSIVSGAALPCPQML